MMDMENTKETQEETFGQMLHDERLKKGKTLRDVANELCIRRVYLEAIEKMEFDKLPPAPYGSGFVRNYARYLGLNAERMSLLYKQLMNPTLTEKTHSEKLDDPRGSPKIWHVLLGMLGLALLIFMWRYWNVENSKTLVEENFSQVDASALAEPQIINSLPEENVDEVSVEQENMESVQAIEDEENTQPNNEPADNHLKFVLTGPSWLELKEDDKVLLSGVYQKGFTYEVPAGENVIISVGRHYNIQFYLNDQPIKVVSAMKKVNVPLDNFFKKDN